MHSMAIIQFLYLKKNLCIVQDKENQTNVKILYLNVIIKLFDT